jgi:hypothetical protein
MLLLPAISSGQSEQDLSYSFKDNSATRCRQSALHFSQKELFPNNEPFDRGEVPSNREERR